MQLSLFEDVDARAEDVEDLLLVICRTSSLRGQIKEQVMNNDRPELIKTFQESIRTYGFSFPGGLSWVLGTLENRETGAVYKVTARELADTALRIYERLNAKE